MAYSQEPSQVKGIEGEDHAKVMCVDVMKELRGATYLKVTS